MTTEERIPAQVFSLAEHLCDEMEARGWKSDDVAIRMGATTERELTVKLLTVDLLLCVHRDGLLISDQNFADLARAFGINETFLRNLDNEWRKWPDRRSEFHPPDSIFGPVSRRAMMRVVT